MRDDPGVSRLFDRVLQHGCQPLNTRLVERLMKLGDFRREEVRERLTAELGRRPTEHEFAVGLHLVLTELEQERVDPSVTSDLVRRLEDAVVISAEEVDDYCATLPGTTDLFDVVASVAPPFPSFFIEFQNRGHPDPEIDSWGLYFSSDPPDEHGWLVDALLVGEFRREVPFGPVVHWRIPLNTDGTLKPLEGGLVPVDSDGNMQPTDDNLRSWLYSGDLLGQDERTAYFFIGSMARLLMPALFAVSLMHCKNVDVRPVDPPERLSRRHERKTGRPLTRYHVLAIEPMRRILDTEGGAQTKGLRHALHICRGHFKTFTEDAPLFGKHVGTYWWPSYARGSAEKGVVEKNYRIRLDGDGVGQSYRSADEDVTVAPAEENAEDPDTSQRGLRAHNRTQNLLAHHVEEAGFAPRSPRGGEPDFDLVWVDDGVVWVAEVKSATERNEERQMRLAIGQVIRYRQQLSEGGREARAMIAVENAPFDESWIDLCGKEGIALVWPEVMAQALGTA